MAGILSDTAILIGIESKDIEIDPFNPKHVNAASYDVTLGDEVTVYKDWVHFDERAHAYHNGHDLIPVGNIRDGRDLFPVDNILDVRREPGTQSFKIDSSRGWVLKPNIGYLMHTRERVRVSNKLVPILDGKSSTGRLFMHIHVTAGYGDPGFNGQFTMEVLVRHPLRVFPGMRIGQVRFHTMEGEVNVDYSQRDSAYLGQTAMGAVGSRAYRQFKKEDR